MSVKAKKTFKNWVFGLLVFFITGFLASATDHHDIFTDPKAWALRVLPVAGAVVAAYFKKSPLTQVWPECDDEDEGETK